MTGQEYCVITIQSEPLYPFSQYHYVSSAEIPGICLVGKDSDNIFKKIPRIIEILFKKNYDLTVKATALGDSQSFPWKLQVEPTAA